MGVWKGDLLLQPGRPLRHQPWANTGFEAALFPDLEGQRTDNEPHSFPSCFPSDTAHPCQGSFSLTSGCFWYQVSWWLHLACGMQALNHCASHMMSVPGPGLGGFHHAPSGSWPHVDRLGLRVLEPASSWAVCQKDLGCQHIRNSFPFCSSAWNLPIICKNECRAFLSGWGAGWGGMTGELVPIKSLGLGWRHPSSGTGGGGAWRSQRLASAIRARMWTQLLMSWFKIKWPKCNYQSLLISSFWVSNPSLAAGFLC